MQGRESVEAGVDGEISVRLFCFCLILPHFLPVCWESAISSRRGGEEGEWVGGAVRSEDDIERGICRKGGVFQQEKER